MNKEKQILGLCQLSEYLLNFLNKNPENYTEDDEKILSILRKSEIENSWFTLENQKFALRQWANLLTVEKLNQWLSNYKTPLHSKKVGLILAGNIPMVGFHDVLSVVLSNHIPLIKLSSKDRQLLPFLLKKWNEFSEGTVSFQLVEKLENFDAVIATGSNNTARYLEYYFKNHLSIIRKNRTSIEEMKVDIIFENFLNFKEVINHHKYANNYEYNRAVYLLNQVKFWDNNFVMLKEDDDLFSPLSVINFSRYSSIEEVQQFICENEENIQAVVAKPELGLDSIALGEAQNPGLEVYADNVDTVRFLEVI